MVGTVGERIRKFWTLNEAAEAASDDNPLAPTRPEHKQEAWPMMTLAFGWGFLITGLLTGGNMAAGMPFWPDLIGAAFIGNSVNFVVGALIGYMGYKTACNSALLYRFTYGRIGVYLPVIFLAMLLTGWQGIVVGAFGFAWTQSYDSIWFYAVAIFAGVLYTATAYYGVKGIQKVSVPSVLILVGVGIYAAYISIDKVGGWDAFLALSRQQAQQKPITFGAGINMVIGSWIVGAVVMPEFTRFAKNGWVAIGIPFVVLMISQYFLQVIGAMGASAFGAADFTTYMVKQGFVVAGLALIGMSLALWTTGDANLYLPAVQTASTFRKPQKAMVVLWGVLGTILGLGIYQHFLNWINLLANIVPPLVGPMIVDYYIVHRCKYDTAHINNLQPWNVAALISYAVGAVSTFYTPQGIVEALWGLIVSMVAYLAIYLAMRVLGIKVGYTQVARA